MSEAKKHPELDALLKEVDGCIDSYHSGRIPVADLIVLRSNLAITLYRLATFTKQVHGEAALGYMRRKYKIAEAIVDARGVDAKKPFNILEMEAQKLPSVLLQQQEEVWAEASKDDLKNRLWTAGKVLDAMQQEISYESQEKKNAHFQNTH